MAEVEIPTSNSSVRPANRFRRGVIIALMLLGIGLGVALFVAAIAVAPGVISDIDDANTEDITDRLLRQDATNLRETFGGRLVCIFPPEDPALVAVRLNLGRYSSNRFSDLVVANRWTIGVLHPDKMKMVVYSVRDDKLRLSTRDAPCGTNPIVRVRSGTPPTAIIEDIEIRNLGARSNK